MKINRRATCRAVAAAPPKANGIRRCLCPRAGRYFDGDVRVALWLAAPLHAVGSQLRLSTEVGKARAEAGSGECTDFASLSRALAIFAVIRGVILPPV